MGQVHILSNYCIIGKPIGIKCVDLPRLRDIYIPGAIDFISPNQLHGLMVELAPRRVIQEVFTKKRKR